jgi:hypothetical protein
VLWITASADSFNKAILITDHQSPITNHQSLPGFAALVRGQALERFV